jgi:hypothetical protein
MTTATLERSASQDEQQAPDPYVTIIRKIRGEHRFITIRESELTECEKREQFVQAFEIYT